MKTRLLSSFTLLALAGALSAGTQTFDFKDPKGVNNAVFKLVAPRETITGSANGVSGTVTFDPANPLATKGKIVVAADTLTVPNPMMKKHLHSGMWLDTANQKEITFEAKELKSATTSGEKTTADVTGTISIKGVTKEITVPVTLTYLKDKLSERLPGKKGDLLVIRATFTIKRSDFGINPGAPQDKVADDIELTLGIAGASVAK